MKRCLGVLLLLIAATSAGAQEIDEPDEPAAPDTLTLQLKWLPQTQFAGYYIAQSQGYYVDEGLDVAIVPGGSDVDPIETIRRGQADVIIEWMPAALVARQNGTALVNIAQIFQTSGQTVACRKDSGIAVPDDLRGKTIAVSMGGNQYAVLAWLNQLGIPTNGSADGVTITDRSDNAGELSDGTADCVSAQTYNELELLKERGFNDGNLTVFNFQDLGVATLQDGLYVTEASLSDPAMVDKLVRFIRASLKGWRVAISKPESTTDIVMREITEPGASRDHQKFMLGEVRKLVGPTDDFLGLMVPDDYDTTVAILTEAGIVSGPPSPAWTHSLWLQAQ
jgi:NitT/TauT family transport system substrate-binding protein